MTTILTPEAIAALRNAEINGNRLVLPEQLPRKVYEEVDKALRRLGGKWNRSARAHLFDDDPRTALAPVLDDELMPRDADKDAAFFRTPPEVADRIIYAAGLYDTAELRVLEPSAGDGALAEYARDLYPWRRLDMICVEPDLRRSARLVDKGFRVLRSTFEDYAAGGPKPFDAVIMNPPFATAGHPVLWAEHVLLGRDLLAPGGRLAAVIPAALTRQHRTVARVRSLLERCEGHATPLPAGAFATSGTGISTMLLVLERGA